MSPLKCLFFLIILFCSKDKILAQQDPKVTKGEIVIHSSSAIDSLERNSRGFKEVKGYRVQIYVGPTSEKAMAERNNFLQLGLGYSAYLKQIVPEYAIRVGDFRNRMEMEKSLPRIKDHYPNAFPVIDIIEPPRYSGKK
jgi:hypothetical protein